MEHIKQYLESLALISKGINNSNYYDWLLEEGKYFREVHPDPKDFYPKFDVMPRECFFNSHKMCTDYLDLRYVEGYYITKDVGVPFEHGFNITPENKVIDVTANLMGFEVTEHFGVEISGKYFFDYYQSTQFKVGISMLGWYYFMIIDKGKVYES